MFVGAFCGTTLSLLYEIRSGNHNHDPTVVVALAHGCKTVFQ